MSLVSPHRLGALILCTALAAVSALVPAPIQWCCIASQGQEEPGGSYRLLWKLEDTHTGWINYRVSVEDYLSPDQLKQLVCGVVRREKPEGFKYVRIFVYHSVQDFKMMIVDQAVAGRTIATYFWNRDMIGKRGWELTVYKDTQGKEYQFEDRLRLRFNHLADCED